MKNSYPLLTLGRLQALEAREYYLLVAADAVYTPGILSVQIPNDALVATNNKERILLEAIQRRRKNGVVWCAAGTGIILSLPDCQVLLAVHRDSGALVYPDLDTIGSGMAGSQAELYYPLQTALREAFEEFLILTPGGVVIPRFTSDQFGFSMTIQDVILEGMRHQIEIRKQPLFGAFARIVNLAGEKMIYIRHLNQVRHCNAIICLDPGGCRYDLMKAIEIILPYRLRELKIFDGELGGDSQALGRDIKAYKLSKKGVPSGRVLGEWRSGKFRSGGKTCKFTPNGQVLFDALYKEGYR
jgi:hypothetical protein